MQRMNTAPVDGTSILVYDGDIWQGAWYIHGGWYGAHHSSDTGNPLDEDDLVAWLPIPGKPEWSENKK